MSTDATIIVVENETDARVTICRMLEDAGYKVIGLKRGIDALGIIGRSPFNAVITDIRLPDVGGLEILELAKEMNPDAAVIMMTSNASVETTVDAVDHGAYAYFVKPINPDELKTTIANALKQQRLSLENKRLIESLQHSRRLLSEANEELRNEITERKQAEENIKRAAEEWRATFDSITDLVFISDRNFRLLRMNKAFADAFKMKPAELISKRCYEIVHGTKAPASNCLQRKTIKTKKPATAELFEPHLGIYLELSTSPIFNEKSEVVGCVHVARDITERKRMEEALRQAEEKYRHLVEATSDMIWEADEKGTFTFVSPRIKDILGYEVNEVIGKKTLDLTPKEEARKWLIHFKEINAKKEPFSGFEITHLHKNGNPVVFETSGIPTFDSAGNFKVFVGINRDITERKQLEKALRENEEKLRLMFESAGEGIVVIDLENKILDVNQVAVRMHGYDSREELIGRSALDLSAEEDRARASSNTRRRLEEGLRGAIEYTLLRKDGSKFPAEVNMATIRDAHGIPIGFISIFVDITERKRIEKEIQEKNEELAEASRAKSEFLAHMSHELRTPLNVIIGFSELMMDELPGEVNEEQGQCLSDIWGSGQHLLSLINDILDLSKIESGKMELKLTNIALPSVIESLRREIMPVIGKREQSLDVEVEEGLPLVRGDKVKVRQVLLNLLSNAAKFTPDGGKLKVEAIRNDDWCQVSVVDRGIGIKKEDQEKIFEPFSQLDDLQAEGRGGTGLGLTLARQIIEKHGGRMWVESKYRKGSKFSFTLPLATADEPHPRGRNRH